MLTGVCVSVSQLVEAIVLPMTHKERFENLGIQPPKGLLFSLLDLSHFSESNSTSCKVLYTSSTQDVHLTFGRTVQD